jgi:hypothetical protein
MLLQRDCLRHASNKALAVSTSIYVLQGRGPIPGRIEFTYQPAMDTIVAMLQAYQLSTVGVKLEHGSVDAHDLRNRTHTLSAGDILIWLGPVGVERVPWAELRRRGIRCIYYRTEPHEKSCTYSAIHETWEYTHANMKACARLPQLIRRYVPPGYVSPRRGAPAPLPRTRSGGNLTVVFLGHIRFNLAARGPAFHHRRERCFSKLRSALPHGVLHTIDSLWSRARVCRGD